MDFSVNSLATDGVDATSIAIGGELDISTAEQLTGPTAIALSAGRPLIVDLSECSFIDSTGLRFLLRTHHALAEQGQAIAVVTDQPQVRDLLSITAIDLSIRVFARRDEAISWLSGMGDNGAHAMRHTERPPAAGEPPHSSSGR